MKIFRKVLWPSKNKTHWPDPKKSIGGRIGAVKDGTRTYWEAIGPARKAWAELGPTIKDCIESTACEYVFGLSVEIYMIGSSKDTASPQILVCAKSSKARNQVLEAIKRREILKDYPAIELAGIDQLPDLLAQDDIEFSILPAPSTGNEITVLTSPLDQPDKPFGRRLFIPKQNGTAHRPATAGPIVYNNNKIYQLTVGHAFLNFGDFPLSEPEPGNLEDHNLDSKSDAKERNYEINGELTGENEAKAKGAWITTSASAKVQGSSSSDLEPPSLVSGRQASLDSGVNFSSGSSSATNNQFQDKALKLTRKFNRVGKLALLSDTSTYQSPDYALVELEEGYRQGRNEVPYNPNGSQIFLQVERPAKKGSNDINAMKDVNVITMTASSGFMVGRLCATASYIRFPNQRTLQELYPVRLEGELVDGDCGAGVVDQSSGNLYGHIVAGIAGTGRAYIVPVEHIFRDIQEKLGGEVTLVAPGKILAKTTDSPWSDELKQAKFLWVSVHKKRLEPLRVVEFASEEYFNQFKQSIQSPKDEKKPHSSVPTALKSASPPISTITSHFTGTQPEGSVGVFQEFARSQKRSRLLKLPHHTTGLALTTSTLGSKILCVNNDTIREIKDRNDRGQRSQGITFEERFFALPSDLQVHVAAYLNVPDILNLRLSSQSWNMFISINQMPISRAFLENNPVPRFVIDLYPPPAPPDLTFQYICGLWHRLHVTSKMATIIAIWITKDIFLRKDESQRRAFLPHQTRMRRRLIPLLFTIFHFFETYRHLHLKHLLENDHHLLPEGSTVNPIERHIMKMYDNETLLQVHQVFPFLISFLERKLRPPSYFGRLERSLRGYNREPLAECVKVGILCIGGLNVVRKLLEIENYDARRRALDDWYGSMFQGPIISGIQPRSLQKEAIQQQLKYAASNPTSEHGSIDSGSTTGPTKHNKGKGKALDFDFNNNISLSASRPMPSLSSEQSQLLLSDLPSLKQIWIPTAEALLLARNAVERRQDIKINAQVMNELILDEFTSADGLFYGKVQPHLDLGNMGLIWGNFLGG